VSRLGSAARHLALAIVPVLLLLLLLELAVRITDADQSCPNRFSTGGGLWVCDPVLHFKVDPEMQPQGQTLNRLGLRGPEFGSRRPGLKRIVALGDSCTFGYIGREEGVGTTFQPYPLKLQRFVERRAGEGKVEVLNAGVPGYNSHHGILLLRSKLRGLDPDLITVRYGWNDHFLSAAGESDLYREPGTRLGLFLQDLALRTRLYGFLRRLGLEIGALRRPVQQQAEAAFLEREGWVPTVSPEQYAANLRRIVELGREQGAEVWLLTSPRNESPDEQARQRLAHRNKLEYEDLVRVHDEYNDIVRRVGRETGSLVVDMDKVYDRYRDAPIFLPTDVVHPAQGGQNLEAETLYTALVRRGWVPPRPVDPAPEG
jgi:lysophospholipase L1-like esterase